MAVTDIGRILWAQEAAKRVAKEVSELRSRVSTVDANRQQELIAELSTIVSDLAAEVLSLAEEVLSLD